MDKLFSYQEHILTLLTHNAADTKYIIQVLLEMIYTFVPWILVSQGSIPKTL